MVERYLGSPGGSAMDHAMLLIGFSFVLGILAGIDIVARATAMMRVTALQPKYYFQMNCVFIKVVSVKFPGSLLKIGVSYATGEALIVDD